MTNFIKKIDIGQPTDFHFHREGWRAVTEVLGKLDVRGGVKFYDWLDKEFKKRKKITHPWSGFLHNVLTYPKEYTHKYQGDRIISLSELVREKFFLESLNNCCGIFTLCKHTSDFLKRHGIKTHFVCHPVNPVEKIFNPVNFKKQVVMIGQWLRRYHSLFELKTDFKKILLKIETFKEDYSVAEKYLSSDAEFLDYVTNNEYDKLLSESVVFLDLYDAAACNTLLECVIRNTPLLINILPATVEYLGVGYPLFYETLEEASEKLEESYLFEAHEYLKNMDKSRFKSNYFLQDIVNSEIYKKFPEPKYKIKMP